MAKIIELILTDERLGNGDPDDPWRQVVQLWTKSGRLVVQHDSYTGETIFFADTLNE